MMLTWSILFGFGIRIRIRIRVRVVWGNVWLIDFSFSLDVLLPLACRGGRCFLFGFLLRVQHLRHERLLNERKIFHRRLHLLGLFLCHLGDQLLLLGDFLQLFLGRQEVLVPHGLDA